MLLKTLGYLTSTLSVLLLGVVSWKATLGHPVLFACLVGGMAASVLGMLLRWLSYRKDVRDKHRIEAEALSR